jgi:N6-adenosine-specific RNA methylase IME4
MRDLIAAELRRTPDRSNNWLAQVLGTTDKTVDAVRQRLITTSEIPKFDRLRGMDGKSRRVTRITTRTVGEAERAQEAIRQITDAATREPEKYEHLLDRMDKTGRYAGVLRDLKITEEAEKIRSEPQPLPQGPYRVAVVDPPWQYDARYSPSRRAVTPYPVMTVDQIKEVPISSIMHEDSVLWVWVTNKHLADGSATEIVKHWGFRSVSIMTWDKQQIGTGVWMRGQTEHAILAVRGDVSPPQQPESTLLRAPRPKGHSVKPDEFYEMVDRLFPGSRVEVFARVERPGWVCWGSELWGTDQVPPKLTPRRRVARSESAARVVVEV